MSKSSSQSGLKALASPDGTAAFAPADPGKGSLIPMECHSIERQINYKGIGNLRGCLWPMNLIIGVLIFL